MADKLILNAGVTGLNSFEKLNVELKNIKKNSVSSLDSLSKKTKEALSSITNLGGGLSKIKTKFSELKSSDAFQTLKSKIEPLNSGLGKLKEKIGGIKGVFGGLKGMIMGAVAAVGLFAFASSSIDAYKDSLEATTKLQANLSTVKAYSGDPKVMKQNLSLMQGQAQALQKMGVYDDDLITAGQAQLSTFQLTGSEINQLMPKMADLVANEKGMNAEAGDFYAKANMIGKAISTGQLAPLRKVGIALSEQEMAQFKVATQTEKVAMMNKILGANVGKVNEELAKTDLGRIQQGTNLWGNMKETVGQGLVQVLGSLAPALYPLMDIIEKVATSFSSGLLNAINSAKPIIDSITNSFNKIGGMESLKGLGDSIKTTFESIGSSLGALFSGIDFGVVFKAIVDSVKGVFDVINSALTFIKPVLDPILNGLGKFVTMIAPFIPVVVKIIAILLLIPVVLSVIMNPITWIIAGIGLVMYAFTHWKEISEVVMNAIKVGIQGVVSFFTAVWNGIVAVAKFVWALVVADVMVRIAVIKAVINGVIFVVKFVFNQVKGAIIGAFNTAKQTVSNTIEGIKSAIGGIVTKVKEIVKAVKDAFNPANWKIPNIKIPFIGGKPGKNYTGTDNWRGGLTSVAERGAEMIQIPGGMPFIAQKEMMMNLPQGTIIKNARDTQNLQNTSPVSEMKNKYTNANTTQPINNTSSTSNASNNNTNSTITMIVQNMSDIKNIEKVLMEVLERVNKKSRLSNLVARGDI